MYPQKTLRNLQQNKTTFRMPVILPVEGIFPKFGDDCFIAPNATIVGDVVMGNECSVWFNAVVRGDVNSIRLGNKVNVQDGAVLHATYQKTKTIVGNNVSIGHNAIVHGCTVHDNVLIGMGAIVMDDVVVEDDVIIGAGSLVPPGKHLHSGYLYVGSPAKQARPLTEAERHFLSESAANYVVLKNEYLIER